MKTLVVGLGNPILGDDGVGWKVAEEVERLLPRGAEVDVECVSLGGISLMERLIGYRRAILVDAIARGDPIGLVQVIRLADLPDYSAFHTTSPHDTSLQNAIKLGDSMGAVLPGEIMVIGITTNHAYSFGETLSEPVAEAVPRAVQTVLDLLNQDTRTQ